ncbi:hypothetical protein EOD42_22545 [Rhodovarius crocodyli]|uniref:Uncharacterized protein n=1 Tax=Rhodovarius crocodyli TaxID=1979269 RepID=A0A437M189_9PROT|nr:hypothetical protein [Rhodovarius crocodyli]RVT91438.1 hypothetical protein EOD42_22545 [Rhodovarius crocodyli]
MSDPRTMEDLLAENRRLREEVGRLAGLPRPRDDSGVIHTVVIIKDPGMSPVKKGPFSQAYLPRFIRELLPYGPTERIVIIARVIWNGDVWIESLGDWLAFAGIKRPQAWRRNLASIERAGGERTRVKLAGRLVRIWSGEHRAYWRDGGHGYTDNRRVEAWLLPFEDAYARVKHCGPEKRIAFEVVA